MAIDENSVTMTIFDASSPMSRWMAGLGQWCRTR
jgi:hypothetical protein